MSTLISAFSSLKNSLASNFAKYVLPTHDGQRNKNEAIGFFLFTIDNLFLLIYLVICATASDCPNILLSRCLSNFLSFSISV
jgi:hypothetical protein